MAEVEERSVQEGASTEASAAERTAPAEAQQASASTQRRVTRTGRRYGRRQRVCAFCAEHITYVDYKQVDVLSRYLSERGQIRPRRKTGLCAKHQRRLAVAIKRARHLALLPFTGEHIRMAARYQG